MTAYPRRSSYGIFVRFRRSRLALRRGVIRLEDALAIAEQLRANRFHDRGDIFVVKEPEGTIVELAHRATVPPPAPPLTAAATPAPAYAADPAGESALFAGPPLHEEAPPGTRAFFPIPSDEGAPPSVPVLLPIFPGPAIRALTRAGDAVPAWAHPGGSAAPGPTGKRGTLAREIAEILLLFERLERFRNTIDRAHAAQERFDRARFAAEGVLRSRGGSVPDALLRSQERLGAVRVSVAQAVDSFERVTTLLERRLEAVWGDAATRMRAS